MYKIVVGAISPQYQTDWYSGNDNPYAVWSGETLVAQVCNAASWITADNYLREHVDVDWGSVAWKANKQELTDFFAVCGWDLAPLKALEPNVDYAVVFIESAGEF